MKKITSKLAIGPMSLEAIEAVFRYSNYYRTELMLIPSKNQVDYAGGYVNRLTTAQFKKKVAELRKIYDYSNVKLCRDHCGPGFNGKYDPEDSYNTIREDISHGFDLIHIDFCHFQGSRQERLAEAKKAIEYCLKLKPDILIEVGTDENVGSKLTVNSIEEIEEEIRFFKDFCNPEFYVVQTGSLVREIYQAGSFNMDFVKTIAALVHKEGWKLKEHNADYLTKSQIRERLGSVDAMNIAPQLGVVQTQYVLTKCRAYGIDCNGFLNEAYEGKKWKKWLYGVDSINKTYAAQIAGHYHFSSDVYKGMIDELSRHEDIHEQVINLIMNVIGHYENCK